MQAYTGCAPYICPKSVQWGSYLPCKICRKLSNLFLRHPVMTVYIHIICNNSALNIASETNLLILNTHLRLLKTLFTNHNLKGPQRSSGGFQTSIKSKMLHPIISNFKYSPYHLCSMSLHSLDLFWWFLKASHTQWQDWCLLLTHWPQEGVVMIFLL